MIKKVISEETTPVVSFSEINPVQDYIYGRWEGGVYILSSQKQWHNVLTGENVPANVSNRSMDEMWVADSKKEGFEILTNLIAKASAFYKEKEQC